MIIDILLMYIGTKVGAGVWFYCVCTVLLVFHFLKFIIDIIKGLK